MTETYSLDQWIWTEADFERMGWHDATIRAMGFPGDEWTFALDIDYILQWINPAPGETHFSFWVAPATLVFENVSDLRIDVEPQGEISIQDLRRDDEQPTLAGFQGPPLHWRWTLDCNEGEITLRATGFRQIFRGAPVRCGGQTLSGEQRGGISFSEVPAAPAS
ncbi:hypothetical protein [Longimicrobium terrae]|uniref:Uncharacterized protein n=1 Tax=Longimicrobium terrae TaxID=1639882 RepID=A0A841GUN9_9BACT|nr:hypothetical protein [Longimicrobium terrae]MBB4634256.1 hypothetical protein [Longimicrobium terrae]MBB6068854.1 hypothetical protein [Longimicrobium terrae]NNC28034.1 hypothetical protein [Longimicrobium terrae]